MGLFDKCILACDVDGTLMINGEVNPRNIEKIKYFMDEGGYFSLSTGRSVDAALPAISKIGRVSPSVVANGCMIYDYDNNKALYETFIEKDDYRIVKKVLDTGLNVGIETHSGNQVLTIKRTSETDDHQVYECIKGKEVSFDEACLYDWNKVVLMFDSLDDLETIKNMIAAEKTQSEFVDTTTFFGGKKRNYYEQFPSGVSKSSALDRLCEILGIKNGGRFAMGDYYNDLEMLKSADIGAVPAEAPDDVKSCADFIAGRCSDGAVADFIDYLTEIRKE